MNTCRLCQEHAAAARRTVCNRCRSRVDRERNPLRYTFENLKHHAAARRIPFLLSLSDWEEFCARTEYLTRRGQSAESLTVDRVKAGTRVRPEPYAPGNINALTRAENSAKGNLEKLAIQAKWDRARSNLWRAA